MIELKEIEIAVSQLPPEKLSEFSHWFEEFMSEQWDKQIEADILAGRLNNIATQIDDDFVAGHVKPL